MKTLRARAMTSFAIVAGIASIVILLVPLAISAATPALASPPMAGDAQHGAYIFSASGGCGCHMGPAGFLAGGQKFEGPFGVVNVPNLTSDKDTGLGKYSDQQIADAIRLGKNPDGGQLFPIMPYASYSGMSDQDVADLVAFLRTAPAIKNAVPEDQLKGPVPPFTPRGPAPATAPTETVARGGYLVNNISACGDCHTPQKADGSPDFTKFLGGTFRPELGGVVPNITPDNNTGIGKWSTAQIASLLRTGKRPDGTAAGGFMAEVVNGGLKNLTDADAAAIGAYLKTVPAVANVPRAPPTLPKTGADNGPDLRLASMFALVGGIIALLAIALRRLYS